MSEDLRSITDPEAQKRVAIAYLGRHIDEAPDDMRHILGRLQKHDVACRTMFQTIEQAKNAIRELQAKIQSSSGAMQELVDMAVGILPDDSEQIKKWFDAGCVEFEDTVADSKTVVSRNPVKSPDGVDMAGSHVKVEHGSTAILKQ